MKKQNMIWLISAIILIFIIKYSGIFSFIELPGIELEPQKYTENWDGIIVNIETPWKGSLSSGQTGLPEAEYPYDKVRICGTDDEGKVSISNSYSINNNLYLSSSISGDRQECKYNYIKTNFSLPKGTLYIDYDLSGVGSIWGDNGESEAILDITGKDISLHLYSFNCDPNRYGCGKDRYGRFNSILDPGTEEIAINEPTEIIVELKVGKSYYGSASGKVTLTFVPSNKITIYRLENNQCNQIEIYEDERTANDYDTLAECESNIEEIMTCEEFCQNLTHEPCTGTGYWNPTGTYPNCNCEYVCEEENQTIIYVYQNYTINETKIIYVEQDCHDIGCPAGYKCTEEGVCIQEQEQPDIIEFLNKEIFTIGEFEIKLWYLIVALLLLILLIPRK